jgi:outer membrane protein assembly factor BamC
MKAPVFAFLACTLIVAGCSAVGDLLESRKVDYKSAGRLPPLEVPPDLTRPAQDDRFVVPDGGTAGSATYSAYSKERAGRTALDSSDVLPKIQNVRVERAGTQRWLVVQGTPAELWPVVKAFWQELGFIINVEIPEAGVMETDWAENRAKFDDGVIRNLLAKANATSFGHVWKGAQRRIRPRSTSATADWWRSRNLNRRIRESSGSRGRRILSSKRR